MGDFVGENVLDVVENDASGVDHLEVVVVPHAGTVGTVTGDTWLVMDNRTILERTEEERIRWGERVYVRDIV